MTASSKCWSPADQETGRCLVFARTKRGTERLAKTLIRQGFSAAMIHGDRTQSQRNAALAGFQRGSYRVLVATDVASRGIHVQDIAHVINYDLPADAEALFIAPDAPDARGTRRRLHPLRTRSAHDLLSSNAPWGCAWRECGKALIPGKVGWTFLPGASFPPRPDSMSVRIRISARRIRAPKACD